MKVNKYCVSWVVDERSSNDDTFDDEKLHNKHEVFERYTEAIKKHTEIKKEANEDERICNLCLFKITDTYDKYGVLVSRAHTPYEKKDEFFKVLYGY